MTLTLDELRQGQRRLAKEAGLKAVDNEEVNRLALKVLGALSEAADQGTRRRALEKARRMLGRR